jgi:hypothetical protein
MHDDKNNDKQTGDKTGNFYPSGRIGDVACGHLNDFVPQNSILEVCPS